MILFITVVNQQKFLYLKRFYFPSWLKAEEEKQLSQMFSQFIYDIKRAKAL